MLENRYDIEVEAHHARHGFSMTRGREVYKTLVRAAQNAQYLHESTAHSRGFVSGGRTTESLTFVKRKQVRRWEDEGSQQVGCYREPRLVRDIEAHMGQNHT